MTNHAITIFKRGKRVTANCECGWEHTSTGPKAEGRVLKHIEHHAGPDWIDKGPFVTSTGRVLTDEDFEALADEAERGYDISPGKRMDRR